MGLTFTDTCRNAIVAAVAALLNGGSLQFQTSGNVAVGTLTLNATAFASPVAGVATANSIADDTNAVGGTIAKFLLKNSSGTEVLRGTVTTTGGGGDITGSTLLIPSGETISITGLTMTQPSS